VRVAGLDFEHFQTAVYKNAVASWFVFFTGGALYYARRRWGQPLRIEIVVVLLLAWVLLLLAPSIGWTPAPLRSPGAFTRYLWLTLLLAGVVCLAQAGRWRALDRAAGNLCYAIYLNHFLVAAFLVWNGTERYLGEPGTLLFGSAVLIGSAGLAAVTYVTVERPLEALRARVRGEVVRDTQPVSLRLPLQGAAVLAGVVVAIVATPPVGLVVERIGASAPVGALRLSPPFDIRWKPEVTDTVRGDVERDLGLTDGQQVARDPRRRTWSYRLPQPTPARVQIVVTHPAVEDTARIDVERFQIVD
jgi:hypothetical protein